ncbi:hypothetical protein [Cupriavidus necator]
MFVMLAIGGEDGDEVLQVAPSTAKAAQESNSARVGRFQRDNGGVAGAGFGLGNGVHGGGSLRK